MFGTNYEVYHTKYLYRTYDTILIEAVPGMSRISRLRLNDEHENQSSAYPETVRLDVPWLSSIGNILKFQTIDATNIVQSSDERNEGHSLLLTHCFIYGLY